MNAFATYPVRAVSTRARWQAFGMAAAIEALIVVVVLVGAARHVQTAEPLTLPVNILSNVTPAAPEPPKSAVLPRPDKPVLAAPTLAPLPAEQIVVPAVPVSVALDAVRAAPVAAPAASQPPPPAPAAPAVPSDEYISKVRAAVQNAFEYPLAAKAQDFKGRARVAFSLTDSRPGDARVIVGSGMNIVDKAALKAVEGASYPPAPEPLKHVEQGFEVWVSFGV